MKHVTVTFLKQWRGHDEGAVVELTDERAAELVAEGTCVEGDSTKAPKATKTEGNAKPKAAAKK
jgi:topoisomerase IA-like protein